MSPSLPHPTPRQDALIAWLRQDLRDRHGPLEPLPKDFLALLEAATLPN